MTQTALPAPHAGSRRTFFGLFDADGWAWATVKAVFWFIVLIVMLGYIPDRAYYFTVQKTVDIGVLKWAPINFCPPENETVPCPAPAGASLPWHPAPGELQLPASRTDGVAAVIGATYLYAGGTDGQTASAATYVSHVVGLGNLDKWAAAPAMPAARADAASVVVGNTLYVIGGLGPDGKPTSTVFTLTVANDGTLGAWKTDAIALPAPRAGASAVAVSDGFVVLGGTDGTVATKSVWKSQVDAKGVAGALKEQYPLFEANTDGFAAHVGDAIFVIGGRNDKNEVVATVQLMLVGGPNATAKDPNIVVGSAASAQTNLPGPRTNLAGFVANGGIYVTGGSDGVGDRTETMWAIPDAAGVIPAWNHLAQTDLGEGIQGASGVAAGSYAFILGGQTAKGVTAGSARANMAPQQPFFQVGLLGLTIPALKLDGEVGQQIGYLNAATVGAVNFILMILIGWAFNHKARTRELLGKLRRKA